MNSDSSPSAEWWASVTPPGKISALEGPSLVETTAFSIPIPAILAEGDDAEPDLLAEGTRVEEELPSAYGTRRLLLTARDPHWLYAHWDLTDEQQRQFAEESADRHLTLRVYLEGRARPPVAEVQVHPDARHWFVHVERAGTGYVGKLGCLTLSGSWIPISSSAPTATPPGRVSHNTSVEFATIPFDVPLPQLLANAWDPAQPGLPLTQALARRLQEAPADGPTVPTWTADQERAIWELSSLDLAGLDAANFLLQAERVSSPFSEMPGADAPLFSPFGGGTFEKRSQRDVNADPTTSSATDRLKPSSTDTLG